MTDEQTMTEDEREAEREALKHEINRTRGPLPEELKQRIAALAAEDAAQPRTAVDEVLDWNFCSFSSSSPSSAANCRLLRPAMRRHLRRTRTSCSAAVRRSSSRSQRGDGAEQPGDRRRRKPHPSCP